MVGGALGAIIGNLGNSVTAHQGYALVASLAGVGAGASAIVKNVSKPSSTKYSLEINSYSRVAEYNLGSLLDESSNEQA